MPHAYRSAQVLSYAIGAVLLAAFMLTGLLQQVSTADSTAVQSSEVEAADGVASSCASGQVCHYTLQGADESGAYIKHFGDNANWNSQFPAMVENDRSVINNGNTGASAETRTGIYGLGSRAYCVTNNGSTWNLNRLGEQGRSHYWISSSEGCL